MKKFVFALAVLLLAAPTWATDVSCSVGDGNDSNLVTVSFAGASAGPVRGMAFDIQLDGDGTLSDVQCLSAAYGYQIFPGSISIDGSGNVSDWGSCKCDGGYPGTLDAANAMTIEMASLYEDGVDPDPCDAGELVSFRVSGTADVNVLISVNTIRGGVVNEDASQESDPNITNCLVEITPPYCMKDTHPSYAAWVTYGRPDCWCYIKQCRGDSNGKLDGPFPVGLPDLTLFKASFNKLDAVLPPNGICCDFDKVPTGPFRVGLSDLTTMKTYFNKLAGLVPDCDATNFNFWITPP